MIDELAKGGMGQVFVAQRHGSSELCVIKLLGTEHKDNGTVAQRFKREAHLLSIMDHPHISKVLDAGSVGSSFYITLEYIGGQTLAAVRRMLKKQDKYFPPEITTLIGLDMLDGLGYAHAHTGADGRSINLVHRDLSPNNVMVSYEGDTKIIDFGIASSSVDDFRTAPGRVLGTARYLSPEQARGEIVDHRSDLYTTAVVLWELYAGELLVQKGPPGQVLRDIIKIQPSPLDKIHAGFPNAVWEVLKRALDKKRDRRWPDAEAFRTALYDAGTSAWTLPPRQKMGLFLTDLFPKGRKINDLVAAYAEEQNRATASSPYHEQTGHDDAPLQVLAKTPLPDDSTASQMRMPANLPAEPLDQDPTMNVPPPHEPLAPTGEPPTELVEPSPLNVEARPLEALDEQDTEGRDMSPTFVVEPLSPSAAPTVTPAPPAPQNPEAPSGFRPRFDEEADLGPEVDTLDGPQDGLSAIRAKDATDSIEIQGSSTRLLLLVVVASIIAGAAAGIVFAFYGS